MDGSRTSPTLFAAAIIVALLSLVALARVPAVAAPSMPLRAARAARPAASAEGVQRLRDSQRLDLNRAGVGDLLLLPGVGPKLAARILEERDRRAGFASVEQLAAVKGVGPKKLAQLRELVAVTDPRAMTQ
jgi:competence protein ComEA